VDLVRVVKFVLVLGAILLLLMSVSYS
jgi:hypothetical protein